MPFEITYQHENYSKMRHVTFLDNEKKAIQVWKKRFPVHKMLSVRRISHEEAFRKK